ncbi:unnamed protein product [Phaeothamnion confervicola]
MKFLLQLIVIAILAFMLELVLPWWSIAIAAFVGGIAFNSRANFLAGFLGVGLLWLFYALLIDVISAAPLAERISKVLFINKPLLLLLTTLIGGLVGGFAAMAGSALRGTSKRSNDDRYYR